MAVGCYVIGERIIHLSLEISETICYASQGCITHFIDACKRLPEKLECLVIVEPEFVQPKILKELFKVGQEYANVVYIIPAIGALLQYTVSIIKHFFMNNILILLKSYENYYACSLMKENNLIYPFCIKTETIESLQHEFYSGFPLKDVHCIHRSHMKEKARNKFKCRFPTANFHRIHPPMIILALGGFYKAMCIAEPGKHLEVANFTPGIFHGNVTIVKRCATFPLKINFMPLVDYPTIFRDTLAVSTRRKTWVIREVEILLPRQHWVKNFVIEYNEFGLLTVEDPSTQLSFSIFNDFLFNSNKVHVWSITKQSRAIFDIAKNERQLVPFDDKGKQ
uniref:Uncharacterized protein n=1 Tax=Panagrolaimus davidi TaxID=227884 RepID=A0A914PU30_9BILA